MEFHLLTFSEVVMPKPWRDRARARYAPHEECPLRGLKDGRHRLVRRHPENDYHSFFTKDLCALDNSISPVVAPDIQSSILLAALRSLTRDELLQLLAQAMTSK